MRYSSSMRQGSIRLFRLAGVNVFLHWSWFLVAAYEIAGRSSRYSSMAWNVLEYLALFAIVLTHEFGHALACRSVGGQADHILLWPFGGVAYVRPPQRPGATLWSIAAGPLVNVILIPVLGGAWYYALHAGWRYSATDQYIFLRNILAIDIGLLAFNILPIYPLDGGQILRSLLWFILGRGRSLMVATSIGFLGVAGFAAWAIYGQSFWMGAIALYAGMNCWAAFKASQSLVKLDKLQRRQGFACPNCHAAPPMGPVWVCDLCGQNFDSFESGGRCPNCGKLHENTMCVECRTMSPIGAWEPRPVTPFATADHPLPPPPPVPIPD
jgi:Zn-dependent protease